MFRRVQRAVALLSITLGMAACGCDTWGCFDGLTVVLEPAPTGAWKIDLFVNGILQEAPTNAACDGTRSCSPGAHYTVRPRDGVSVRVTSDKGERTTTYGPITYTGQYKDSCHDCKGQAQIVANIP